MASTGTGGNPWHANPNDGEPASKIDIEDMKFLI